MDKVLTERCNCCKHLYSCAADPLFNQKLIEVTDAEGDIKGIQPIPGFEITDERDCEWFVGVCLSCKNMTPVSPDYQFCEVTKRSIGIDDFCSKYEDIPEDEFDNRIEILTQVFLGDSTEAVAG